LRTCFSIGFVVRKCFQRRVGKSHKAGSISRSLFKHFTYSAKPDYEGVDSWRLWLPSLHQDAVRCRPHNRNAGSVGSTRPEYSNHVWSYGFVEDPPTKRDRRVHTRMHRDPGQSQIAVHGRHRCALGSLHLTRHPGTCSLWLMARNSLPSKCRADPIWRCGRDIGGTGSFRPSGRSLEKVWIGLLALVPNAGRIRSAVRLYVFRAKRAGRI
jgi:hypothetical protein